MRIVFISLTLAAAIAAQQPAAKKNVAGDDKQGYTDTPQLPGQKWKVHDAGRPRPPKVTPGLPVPDAKPPSDAIVLFNGKDLSQWEAVVRNGQVRAPQWKVENGYMEIKPRTGRLRTKAKFGDCQLHVEWMIPKGSGGAGQGAGNSGVELMGRYEIQVLESYKNVTYADGQAASIYGQWPPLVNASRPEGEWNVYDIFFEAPKFEGEKLVKPAYITVVHNGVLVHHHQAILGRAIHRRVASYQPHNAEEPLSLQDHGRPMRYRNIWIRKLKGYDEP
ncbi:MAG: DUF1080 domain-containing protein [Bryobacteraceae bacterium]